jgi:hypothetical protein
VVTNLSLTVMSLVLSLRDAVVEMVRDGERGQDIIEYVVVAGAISLAAAIALILIDPQVFTDFVNVVEGCLKFDQAACN